jgi:plastocyanin
MNDRVMWQRDTPCNEQWVAQHWLFWLTLVLTVLVITGCGGDQPEPVALTLLAQDIKFDVNTLTVKADQPVTLTYRNEGVIDHSLEIEGVFPQQKVRPGQTQIFEFELQTPGSYEYVCSLPGHEQAGMVGTLIVE